MNLLGDGMVLDPKISNRILERTARFQDKMGCFDGSNDTGIFKVKFCKKLFYFITQPGFQIKYPSLDSAFSDSAWNFHGSINFRSSLNNSVPLALPSVEVAEKITRARPLSELAASLSSGEAKRQKIVEESFFETAEALKRFGRNCHIPGQRVKVYVVYSSN